ncbi:MAG: glycosyltransferase [Desulfobacula sp.]|jgi:polysaccharide biosynthesis protein PslH|nr:glycosyltransferase [Desulfobacula sp.]
MRVLVIDEELPFPVNTGKRLRTFNLLKFLAPNHEITFMCRQPDGNNTVNCDAFEKLGINVITVPHPILKKEGLKFYLSLFANLFSVYPYSVSSHYSGMIVEAIKTEVNKKCYDLIHCEWTPYAINLKQFVKIPIVLNAHNVEAMIWKRNVEVAKNPVLKAYVWLQWKKMVRFERKAFVQFKGIATVSEPDKAVISKTFSPEKIMVIENGVDVNYFQSSNNSMQPLSLVFTGSMDWRPNVDAMIYFLDCIWPLLVEKCPEVRLTIVGRNPMPALKMRVAGENNVKLTGTVDDVRPFISQAAVYIVPLRVGGGSRLKILEALSMKKAVVSTTIGAEGLDLSPEKDIVIADSPEDFAHQIVALFADEVLCRELAMTGQKTILKSYQWHNIAKKLDRLWREAVK